MRSPTYAVFKATQAQLEAEHRQAVAALDAATRHPRGPMGLPDERDRTDPAWRAAWLASRAAFAALRALNGAHASSFKREIRADIDARRVARASHAP